MFFFNIHFHPSAKLDTAGTDRLHHGCVPGNPRPDPSKNFLKPGLRASSDKVKKETLAFFGLQL